MTSTGIAFTGMPINAIPLAVIRDILAGGESVCARAGIPIAGGHTIDSVEPIYGLVAVGLVHPANVKRNAGARPGDKLVLGKPLGVGVYSAALKKEKLSQDDYRTMIASTTQLNTPGIALALVGMPVNQLPLETIRKILEGGEAVCARAGIPVAGGHTIDSVEPIYGLVAIGLVDPSQLKRNAGARPGDRLVLGKPIGVGVMSAALKKEKLSAEGYAAMIASTTKLNTPGIALGKLAAVHALTDVTGFGLLGHLLEICRGSGAGATLDFARVPLHPDVLELARAGYFTGASARNFAGYGGDVDLGAAIGDAERALLTDPQTSGGLLVACAPDAVAQVLGIFRAEGFADAAEIGEITAGPARVAVR